MDTNPTPPLTAESLTANLYCFFNLRYDPISAEVKAVQQFFEAYATQQNAELTTTVASLNEANLLVHRNNRKLEDKLEQANQKWDDLYSDNERIKGWMRIIGDKSYSKYGSLRIDLEEKTFSVSGLIFEVLVKNRPLPQPPEEAT